MHDTAKTDAGGGHPLYSVVIPTYDRRVLLVDAVESILAQDYPALEIIVVDDGSCDGTSAAMAGFGPAVRYLYQSNQGPSAARNLGVQASRGAFVAFLDSDDIWLPGKIAHDVAVFASHPEAGAVVGDADYYSLGICRHPSHHAACGVTFETRTRPFGVDLLRLSKGPLCPTSTMVFRRAVLERLGPEVFDPSLRYQEDWDLEFRLFAQFTVMFSRERVATCRQFVDHTRPFGLPDDDLPAEDRARLVRNGLRIIDRYQDWDVWPRELRRAMKSRADVLRSEADLHGRADH